MRSPLLRGAVGLSLALSAPALAARGGVRLQDGAGRVELYPEGAQRGVGILPGEALGEGALKTGDKSRATLATPDGATVELGEKSAVSVASGTDTTVSLTAGKVVVDDPPEGGKVQVKAGEALTVEAPGGKFEVQVKKGEVTITADKGQVEVASKDQKGAVAEGKSLTIKNGKLPADAVALLQPAAKPAEAPKPEEKPAEAKPEEKPAPKPEAEVAAKVENKPAEKPAEKAEAPAPTPAEPPQITVEWPQNATEGEVKVKGQVSGKDVKVTVNGARAKLRSSGKFEAKVELAAGEQVLEVVATAPDGQSAKESQKVTVAAKPAEEAKPAAEAKPEGEAEAKPAEGEEKPKKKSGNKPKVQQEASGWE